MEVLNAAKTELQEAVADLPKEISIENGKVLVHDEIAYGNFFKKGKSLEEIGEGKDLEFTMRFKFHKDGLAKLKNVGNCIQSNPMSVYHNFVMWTYGMAISVKEVKNEEIFYELVLVSVGPCFSKKKAMVKGGFGNNCPENQKPPQLKEVKLELEGKTATIHAEDYKIPRDFTSHVLVSSKMAQLFVLVGDSMVLNVNLKAKIELKYFDIHTFLPKLSPIELSPAGCSLLSTILSGSKPSGYDWAITVDDGKPREFYVHEKILADSSPILAAALQSHSSVGQNVMLMVSDENRIILPTLKAEDMKVVRRDIKVKMNCSEERWTIAKHISNYDWDLILLSYIYLRTFTLPNFDGFARVGRILCAFFPQQISNFFARWEIQIIEDLEKLDRSDWSSTLPKCAAHLVSIFCSPYGAFPVAKKVAIAVMADTWNMAESAGVDLVKELSGREEFKCVQLQNIMLSMDRFRTVICSVEKKAI